MNFARALMALATALGFDLDEAVVGVYWHALKDLPDDLRVETLLECGNRKWFKFPKPADVKELAAGLMDAKRKRVFFATLPPGDTCPTCFGTRWKTVNVNGVNREDRCDCWKAAMQAMDRVGQAVALPPSREDAMEIGS